MSLNTIIASCGIGVTGTLQVHGGDINTAYRLDSATSRYFLKVNDAEKYPDMLLKEAAGLTELRKKGKLYVPAVLKTGIEENQQYLLLEWIEKGRPSASFWTDFGHSLAALHQEPQPWFGWKTTNYIGRVVQDNKQHDTWDEFYTECRIMPLVERLFNLGIFDRTDLNAAGHFCNALDSLFPAEPPALLHGDLWSGNYSITEAGHPVIFDPAVYYGHREMDLGMTQLFGGFDNSFYEAYNEQYPLEPGWQKRMKLTQAWPLLVHAVLFEGIYISKARAILRYFNEWA